VILGREHLIGEIILPAIVLTDIWTPLPVLFATVDPKQPNTAAAAITRKFFRIHSRVLDRGKAKRSDVKGGE
jgi:hypothetical protein